MQDIIIIGAGILGSTIARYLCLSGQNVMVIDAGNEIIETKGTALIQTGCFALPNTMRSRFTSRGYQMMEELSQELPFSYKKTGALLPCFTPLEMLKIREFHQRAKKNRITDLRILWADALKVKTNSISESVYSSLYMPGCAIVDSRDYLQAMRKDALTHHCAFRWNEKVTSVQFDQGYFITSTTNGTYISRLLINAAGLDAQSFHNQFSDNSISLYEIQRKTVSGHLDGKKLPRPAIVQMPSSVSKEAFLIPTSEHDFELSFIEDKPINPDAIFNDIQRVLPNIRLHSLSPTPIHASYYISQGAKDVLVGEVSPGYFEAIGFDTCGISAAPAVAQYLTEQITQQTTR